jgi:hypothetical protein
MITQFDFLQMSMNDQAEAVWKGTFLGDRNDGIFTVQLFSLGSFYVEVFYNAEINKIERLTSFIGTYGLAAYI